MTPLEYNPGPLGQGFVKPRIHFIRRLGDTGRVCSKDMLAKSGFKKSPALVSFMYFTFYFSTKPPTSTSLSVNRPSFLRMNRS